MNSIVKKKRIFQIAKELNISHLEIINFLKANGSEVDSHMAPVSSEVYDEILLEFSKDKLQIERHRKEQARKVVVSKMQKKDTDEPVEEDDVKPAKKIEPLTTNDKLELSSKLKDASNKLSEEKKKNKEAEEKKLKEQNKNND